MADPEDKPDLTEADIPTHPPNDELPADMPAPAPPTPQVPPAPSESPPALKIPLDKERILSFIEDIIDTLTFKRIGLIALLTVFSLIIYSFYENRISIINNIVKQDVNNQPEVKSWTLSENSKVMLQNLAETTAVVFVAISDVDLKKNRRSIRYYFFDDKTLLTPDILRSISLPQPVFDYDGKNTTQLVSILSNEFRCDPFVDTLYNRFVPSLQPKFPTICRLAIPPFVGQFVGIITVGISQQVTPQELESIRLEVSRIAVDIYLNDVIKKPSTTPQ